MCHLRSLIFALQTLAAGLTMIGPLAGQQVWIGSSPGDFSLQFTNQDKSEFAEWMAGVNVWGLALDPESGDVYYSDPTAGTIGRLVQSTGSGVVQDTLLQNAGAIYRGIALDWPRHRLFYLDSADDSVNLLDLGSMQSTRIAVIPGMIRPNDLVYDAVQNTILITDSGSDSLFILESDKVGAEAQVFTAAATQGVWGIAIHPETREVYFSSHDLGMVFSFDTHSMSASMVADGIAGPRGLCFDRSGRLFCSESGQNRVIQVPLPGEHTSVHAYATVLNGRALLVFNQADRDGDFLPDEWEMRHVGSIHDMAATTDADADGRTAMEEYLFNTSPSSSGDPAQVRAFVRQGDGSIRVSIEGAAAGGMFSAMISPDLQNWEPVDVAPTESPLEDSMFSKWEWTITDFTGSGYESGRVFVRFSAQAAKP